jgi:hypothetical protein
MEKALAEKNWSIFGVKLPRRANGFVQQSVMSSTFFEKC